MKTLLSAALLLAATSVAANAADLNYKAAPMAQSVYNWTGFYLGGNAGGGIANSSHLDPDGLLFTNTKFQEGFGTVGLTAGYNWQIGHTVLGIEGDYNWANVDKTKSFSIDNTEITNPTTQFKMSEFATLRARAGLALDRTLVYATAGLAFGHIKNNTSFAEDGGFLQFSASEDKWKTGLAVGAGVEFAITQNWTLKGEYLLMQFQGSDTDVNLLAGTASVNSCSNGSNCRMNYSESVQTARVGLNYKFGY